MGPRQAVRHFDRRPGIAQLPLGMCGSGIMNRPACLLYNAGSVYPESAMVGLRRINAWTSDVALLLRDILNVPRLNETADSPSSSSQLILDTSSIHVVTLRRTKYAGRASVPIQLHPIAVLTRNERQAERHCSVEDNEEETPDDHTEQAGNAKMLVTPTSATNPQRP